LIFYFKYHIKLAFIDPFTQKNSPSKQILDIGGQKELFINLGTSGRVILKSNNIDIKWQC
jgi:hypothetical protein